jgi:hypothetical protein
VRLLLDENCAGGRELARRLRSDEHHVQTTIAALGAGVSDAAVAAMRLRNAACFCQRIAPIFARLYVERRDQPGILLFSRTRRGG